MNYLQPLLALVLVAFFCADTLAARPAPPLREGDWSAWLNGPGGAITFGIMLEQKDDGWHAALRNGAELAPVPQVRFEGDALVLEFVHYNSVIRARPNVSGTSLSGTWHRVSGPDTTTEMEFRASWAPPPADDVRLKPTRRPGRGDEVRPKDFAKLRDIQAARQAIGLTGEWIVDFDSSDEPAIAAIELLDTGSLGATFLTTTGDYRFLSGELDNDTLRLSVFDGAHAFLFVAQWDREAMTLDGDFWSRDTWHETWTAKRDTDAALPDAFGLTTWRDGADLSTLKYPGLDGEIRSPVDPAFAGKARIIEVFGTWCPNCNDATIYLKELHETYAARGLSIVSLAFEMTNDLTRDTAQVQRYVDHHNIAWPVLVAGSSNKDTATEQFPVLDRIRSFPTFIFLDATGEVKAIYQGFNGPATGDEYEKLRTDFERIIEGMLGD